MFLPGLNTITECRVLRGSCEASAFFKFCSNRALASTSDVETVVFDGVERQPLEGILDSFFDMMGQGKLGEKWRETNAAEHRQEYLLPVDWWGSGDEGRL